MATMATVAPGNSVPYPDLEPLGVTTRPQTTYSNHVEVVLGLYSQIQGAEFPPRRCISTGESSSGEGNGLAAVTFGRGPLREKLTWPRR